MLSHARGLVVHNLRICARVSHTTTFAKWCMKVSSCNNQRLRSQIVLTMYFQVDACMKTIYMRTLKGSTVLKYVSRLAIWPKPVSTLSMTTHCIIVLWSPAEAKSAILFLDRGSRKIRQTAINQPLQQNPLQEHPLWHQALFLLQSYWLFALNCFLMRNNL